MFEQTALGGHVKSATTLPSAPDEVPPIVLALANAEKRKIASPLGELHSKDCSSQMINRSIIPYSNILDRLPVRASLHSDKGSGHGNVERISILTLALSLELVRSIHSVVGVISTVLELRD